jgi:hypothetical protein
MNRSESIDKFVEGFSKAQGCFKKLVPNEYAAGGKFANLQAILESVREALSSNGLSFYQQVELLNEGNGVSLLHSVVSHSSGQWISTSSRIVPGPTFRETFNCIEAYRRLSALLLLGIAPSGNDPLVRDDNGEEQQEKEILSNLKKPENIVKGEFVETITAEQYKDLMIELDGYGEIAKGIQTFYKISSIADLPKSEYYTVQGKIRKLKKTHEEYVREKR